jgi:histidine ammonia-lyase
MNQEDIVSMGTTAARKARMILKNTQDVLADELMTACQAIDIRRHVATHGQGVTPLHQALYEHVREKVAFYEVDREIAPDIRACESMIRSGELLEIVRGFFPDFD